MTHLKSTHLMGTGCFKRLHSNICEVLCSELKMFKCVWTRDNNNKKRHKCPEKS